jgi:ADP-ribose pyrophosphatase
MTLRRNREVLVIDSKTIFEGRIFDLVRESVRLPSGLVQELVVVDHPGAVAIAAVDERGELLIVRQYRHSIGDWLHEIPAGRLEPGEDPLRAARRELEEETRHRARSWELLREFHPAPGFCSETITLFLARDLEEITDGALAADDDEEIEVVRMSPRAIIEGAIRDAKTLVAAAMLLQRSDV